MRSTIPWLLGLLAAAGGPAAIRPADAPARADPTIDAFAVLAEADRLASLDLWPGFDPRRVPVAIYDGRNTLLFRHPAPPAGFHPMTGVADAWVLPRRHPAVSANGTAELGGVRTATLIPPEAPVPLRSQAGVLIHEAFHVFQRERYPGWTANEVELFTYPVDDAAVLALRRAGTEALRRALVGDDDAAAACWAQTSAALGRERLAGLPPAAAAYERQLELLEGLATYVERRATGAPDSTLLPAGDFPPDAVRGRAYRSGAAVARLLDRLDAGWRHELDRDPSTTLDALLDRALAGHAEAGTGCAFGADEVDRFRTAAARDIDALRDGRTAERDAFLDRSGWRIVVVADGQPLFPQAFDPLNVRIVSGGEVLHTRFLRLGNDSGTIEVLGRAVLTQAAGAHPLFNGVRAIAITGLDAEPRIAARRRVVTVEADGVAAEFRGAAVERDGRTVTLRLPPP